MQGIPLRNAEHNRGEDGKQDRRAEVGEFQVHGFFPMAM
jgi:hypothetical protein